MGSDRSAAGGGRSDLSEWQRSAGNEPALTGEVAAGHRNRVNWQAIKTEYITTDTSYRKLAQKYGISHVQIGNVGRDEKWVELRRQHLDKTMAKAVNAIGTKQAEMAAKLYGVGGLLLDRVKLLLEDNPELLADTSSMKDVSVVLKNLKDLMSVKSDADMREQEARIEKLRREAEPEKQSEAPKLIVEGLPEEFKV